MKIIQVSGSEKLNEWELERLNKLDATFFIYNYERIGGYEGNGFAVWDISDGKYGYTILSHCSCYGPLDDINSIPYTLDELKKIALNYPQYAGPVIDMLELSE